MVTNENMNPCLTFEISNQNETDPVFCIAQLHRKLISNEITAFKEPIQQSLILFSLHRIFDLERDVCTVAANINSLFAI